MGRTRFSGPIDSRAGFDVDGVNVISSGGLVATDALTEEGGVSKGITAVSSTGGVTVGKPVYISGIHTDGKYKMSLARANAAPTAAQFVVTSPSTAANGTIKVAEVAEIEGFLAIASTNALGSMLYLSATAAGVYVASAPTAMFSQTLGIVTRAATSVATGDVKFIPGYSKAINPASI